MAHFFERLSLLLLMSSRQKIVERIEERRRTLRGNSSYPHGNIPLEWAPSGAEHDPRNWPSKLFSLRGTERWNKDGTMWEQSGTHQTHLSDLAFFGVLNSQF